MPKTSRGWTKEKDERISHQQKHSPPRLSIDFDLFPAVILSYPDGSPSKSSSAESSIIKPAAYSPGELPKERLIQNNLPPSWSFEKLRISETNFLLWQMSMLCLLVWGETPQTTTHPKTLKRENARRERESMTPLAWMSSAQRITQNMPWLRANSAPDQ